MKTNDIVYGCLDMLTFPRYANPTQKDKDILTGAAVKLMKQQKCLQWIVDNWDISHPDNILSVAKEGLE